MENTTYTANQPTRLRGMIEAEAARTADVCLEAHFNAGRPYSHNSQRISVRRLDEKTALFYDHDRHIDGEINAARIPEAIGSLCAFALHRYDTGAYAATMDSFAFATAMRGALLADGSLSFVELPA